MALRKISKKVLMEAHDLNLWVAIVVRKKSDPCRAQLLAEADRRERKTGRKLLDRLLLPGNAGVVTPYGG